MDLQQVRVGLGKEEHGLHNDLAQDMEVVGADQMEQEGWRKLEALVEMGMILVEVVTLLLGG